MNDSKTLRSAVGVSLLWNSPVGLLRADIAHVLSSATFDDEQIFRFGGSSAF
ncbi:MAG: BamA/TamA family outer membrane protein [Fimbriimonadaceae bacterium]|nr:BamA/TamA family outer membrane protein [Alphaproteobacteria bacterium]